MIKEFCDRCGEIIQNGKYKLGDYAHVEGPPADPERTFNVELKISHAQSNWKLCTYCADEIIDKAYAQMVENRKKPSGNFFERMRRETQ